MQQRAPQNDYEILHGGPEQSRTVLQGRAGTDDKGSGVPMRAELLLQDFAGIAASMRRDRQVGQSQSLYPRNIPFPFCRPSVEFTFWAAHPTMSRRQSFCIRPRAC